MLTRSLLHMPARLLLVVAACSNDAPLPCLPPLLPARGLKLNPSRFCAAAFTALATLAPVLARLAVVLCTALPVVCTACRLQAPTARARGDVAAAATPVFVLHCSRNWDS